MNIHLYKGEKGFTVLELFVSLVLSGLLALGFFGAYKKNKIRELENGCAKDQADWRYVLEDLESELKKWTWMAPECLASGYKPWEVTDQKKSLQRVLTARPLLRDMKFPQYLELPKKHEFVPGQELTLCDGQSFTTYKIKALHTSTSSNVETIEIVKQAAETTDPAPKLFLSHTLAIATAPEVFNLEPHKQWKNVLQSSIGSKPKKRLAQNFDFFNWSINDSSPDSRIQLSFERKLCRIEREIFLKPQSTSAYQVGLWTLGQSEISIKPWEDLREPPNPPLQNL